MLRAAIVFFILAIIAAFLGFGGLSADAAWVAKVAFLIFLVVSVISFVFGRRGDGLAMKPQYPPVIQLLKPVEPVQPPPPRQPSPSSEDASDIARAEQEGMIDHRVRAPLSSLQRMSLWTLRARRNAWAALADKVRRARRALREASDSHKPS